MKRSVCFVLFGGPAPVYERPPARARAKSATDQRLQALDEWRQREVAVVARHILQNAVHDAVALAHQHLVEEHDERISLAA